MAQVARRCNLVGTEDLLASLGFGGVTLHQVLNRLREEIRLASAVEAPPQSNEELAAEVAAQGEMLVPSPTHGAGVASPILGLEGLDYRMGGCCSPLPGEPIVGSVSLGNHGITIHRQDCGNVQQIPVARRLPVRWNPASEAQQRRYPVQLRIEVLDRVGVLKDILMRLSDHRINVSDARVRTSPGKPARIDLRVELQSATQLMGTLNQIRAMADVLDIARTGIG
jgi:(p)ppGpp synthase/HD superfamily hydrolase